MSYRLIDADGHYYEADDCFSRHIEQRYKSATVRVDRTRADGLGRVYVGDRRTFMSVMPGDYASAPGAKLGLFSGKQEDGFAHKEVINARDYPAFTDQRARLAFMDEQDIEATLMLPTLAVAVEEDLAHDVELTYASLRAFNRWLEEDWSYGQEGRLFGVPMLSLLSLDHALVELRRVLEAGARLVHLRPGPVGGKSPAHPTFDPFWATLAEAGVGVVFHVSNSGYNSAFGALWSESPTNPSHNQSPLQWALCNTERPIVDTLTALTLHNLFGRHPAIRIVSIENGSSWLKPLLKAVDKAAALGRQGPMIGGTLPDKPSKALLEHLWVSPFPEDDVPALIELLGADKVLFGSDYPHPEGLRLPRDFLPLLDGFDASTKRKVLRSNTAQLVGLAEQDSMIGIHEQTQPTHRGLGVVEELARRFSAGQFDTAFDLYHPKVQIVQPSSLPHGGVHQGREGVRAMGSTFAKFWERTISVPQRTPAGEGVVQVTTQTWTAKSTGRSATVEVVELFTFVDDLVSEIRVFQHDTQRLMATLESADTSQIRRWQRTGDLRVVDAATVDALARHWQEGWNREDVDTVVAPFADDVLFSSPYVSRFGDDHVHATLHGLAAVRKYVADSFVRATRGIKYTLDVCYAGTDTVVLSYTVHHPTLGARPGIDTMRLGADGKVVEWRCQYPFES